MAASTIPRAFLSRGRSAFCVIDPFTEEYHRILDRSATAQLGQSQRSGSYFAISYVWDDWKENPDSKYPSWTLIRDRLLKLGTTDLISGTSEAYEDTNFFSDLRDRHPDSFRCWIDNKCINQDLAPDKAYWIPRMNEVYFDAQCTLLLLRDMDLTALFELCKIMKCLIREAGEASTSHKCLFTPSCISLCGFMSESLEEACLDTLEALWYGQWRTRAWIFQEILLSTRYMLCWGDSSSVAYMELAMVGRLAAFFHSRHPDKMWLHEFWTWCKQYRCLRQFYSDGCDMEATVLQLAHNLDSTLPCDKYYAICGVLGLKDIEYRPEHTAEQALDNVIAALTKQGRMGWMYAIPSSINGRGVEMSDRNMAPFVLTRKMRQTVIGKCQESFISDQYIGFPAVDIGAISEVISLAALLRYMHSRYKAIHDAGISHEGLQNLWKTTTIAESRLPAILFRLGYDVINAFRERATFKVLYENLQISTTPVANDESNHLENDVEKQSEALWLVTLRLIFLRADSFHGANPLVEQLVQLAAGEIQTLCKSLVRQHWHVIIWIPLDEGESQVSLASMEDTYPSSVNWVGRSVWSIKSQRTIDSLMVIADRMGVQRQDDASHQIASEIQDVTYLSEPNANFIGIVLQVPKLLPLIHTFDHVYHENPREFHGGLIYRLFDNVVNTFENMSKSLADIWDERARFLIFARRSIVRQDPFMIQHHPRDTDFDMVIGQFDDSPIALDFQQYESRQQSCLELDDYIKTVKAMFPALEEDLLADIIESYQRDFCEAVNACLALSADKPERKTVVELHGRPLPGFRRHSTHEELLIDFNERAPNEDKSIVIKSMTDLDTSSILNIPVSEQTCLMPNESRGRSKTVNNPFHLSSDANSDAEIRSVSAPGRALSNNPYRRHLTPELEGD